MLPVSVIHHPSWKGRPNTFSPHLIASGFNGSPTLLMSRKLERSYLLIISVPAFISILIAVGAVYQTLTLYSSIIEYHFSGSNLPPCTTCETPLLHVPRISYTMPVTHPGSA